MDVIGVLFRVNPHSLEPYLSSGFVNMFNLSNDPISMCESVLQFLFSHVKKVEMVPSVTFTHPNQFFTIAKPVFIAFLRIIDKRVACFFNNRLGFSISRVYGNYSKHLMSSRVIIKGKLP